MFVVIAKGTAREFISANKPILEQNPAKNLEPACPRLQKRQG